ncbi:MAG: radical SAM protein [Bacillota bacterium]
MRLRVSLGTAQVLGLRSIRQPHPPTTAYLMWGEKCRRDCAFCAQARGSDSRADLLSRVTWPAFPAAEVIPRLSGSGVRRVCVQVVEPGSPREMADLVPLVGELAASGLPVCVSCFLPSLKVAEALLRAGADGVTLPLDAASPGVYQLVKGGSLAAALAHLEKAARAFPGRVGTHLIAGLGESEEEMVLLIGRLVHLGVRVGLFAFTPVAGTRMAHHPPPSLESYRRVQAAHYLLRRGLARAEEFTFEGGRLTGFGSRFPPARLRALLADGEAFRTTGCPDCNRPYYNERPGQPVPYNYPHALDPGQAEGEVQRLLSSLEAPGGGAGSPVQGMGVGGGGTGGPGRRMGSGSAMGGSGTCAGG